MKTILISIFLIIGFSTWLMAQNDCMKVLYSQGNIQLNKDGKSQSPRTGTTACGSFTIHISPGSSIALISGKNQSAVLDKPGSYTRSAVEAIFSEKAFKSVTKAYLDLIVERFLDKQQPVDEYYQVHKRFFVEPAGVERGLGDKYLALPSKSKVLPGKLNVYTLSELNKTAITAQVFDFQTSTYASSHKIETEKVLQIELKEYKAKEAQFSLNVKAETGQSAGEVNYMLEVVKHPFLTYPKTEDEFSAMDWFGLGLAFEQNHYYADALNCLIQAQKLNPGIEFYGENIVRLLNLIGFDKEDSNALAKYWRYNLN